MLSPKTWEFAEHDPPSPPAHPLSLPPSRPETPTNGIWLRLSNEKALDRNTSATNDSTTTVQPVAPEQKKTDTAKPLPGRHPTAVRFAGVDDDDLERPLTPPDFNRIPTQPAVMSGTDTTPKITIEGELPSGDEVSNVAKIMKTKALSPVDKAVRDAQLAKCVKTYFSPPFLDQSCPS